LALLEQRSPLHLSVPVPAWQLHELAAMASPLAMLSPAQGTQVVEVLPAPGMPAALPLEPGQPPALPG